MVGSCGATPPASKRMTRLGAAVRCASIAAAHGTPVPTATVRPSSSRRAAQQIISSIWLYGGVMSGLDRITPLIEFATTPRTGRASEQSLPEVLRNTHHGGGLTA